MQGQINPKGHLQGSINPTGNLQGTMSTEGLIGGQVVGMRGFAGNGIESAVLNEDYTLTLNFTNGTSYTTPSIRGQIGETGNGIASITKTGTSGLVDTYTITFTNGQTTNFYVTNGKDGASAWEDITGKPSVFPPSPHNHDDRYYTETEIDEKLIDAGRVTDVQLDGVSVVVNKIANLVGLAKQTAITGLNNAINGILALIPSGTTNVNHLTNKDYVDEAINSVSAFYITKDAIGNGFDSYAQLSSATVFYSGGEVRTPTRNDYCIVRDDEEHDNATTRYWYQNNWQYQYTVNETALTPQQVLALNSGITAELVATYNAKPSEAPSDNKQYVRKNGAWEEVNVTTKEDVANKVTSISASSTDTQYPSAKAVYDGKTKVTINRWESDD